MNELTICLFAASILLLIFGNIYQFRRNIQLTKELVSANTKIDQTEKNKKDILGIEQGDKGILPNYNLTWTETDADGKEKKTSFSVTYEVEIVEVALKQLKLKAIDVTPVDSSAMKLLRDPACKADVLKFMQNKWLERKSVQLVVDDVKRRNDKLNQILN